MTVSNSFDVLQNETSQVSESVQTGVCGFSSGKIHLISVNINGVRGKTLEIAERLQNDKTDVLICQVTKLDSSVGSSELFPPGYTVYRKDRNLRGGGVCITVSNKLRSSQCMEMDADCEAIWVKITTSDNSPIYVSSYYRPSGSHMDTVEMLRKPLDTVHAKHRKKPPFVVLCGDVNYPLIN